MKKLMSLFLAALLVCLAVPALAQSDVDLDVQVNKDVYARQFVDIDKYLDLKVEANIDPGAWAQCEVYKTDLNKDNTVIEIFDPRIATAAADLNVNEIMFSFNGFTGIAQVNQAAGSLNNQGNITAIAVTNTPAVNNESFGGWGQKDDPGLSHTAVAVEQVNHDNCLISVLVTHRDEISNSFNEGFTGIAQVNQASGFMNNQNNVVGVSANLNQGAVALSDAYLVQNNTENKAIFAAVNYQATINAAFNGATGIAQVNQAPGSMNNQANVVSISYAGATRP